VRGNAVFAFDAHVPTQHSPKWLPVADPLSNTGGNNMVGPEIEMALRREICLIGRTMYDRGLVVACEGNVSARLGPDRILVTPTGMPKGGLTPDSLVVSDLTGAVVCGARRPSSEIRMHLLYYRARPDVMAVCHAHPPTATGFAAAGRALEQPILPEVIIGLGTVPLAAYGTPGTRELCAALEPLVEKHDAILLENHGVVTCGPTLAVAFQHLETVEQLARVLLTAESLGGPRLLTGVQVQRLIAATSRGEVPGPENTMEFLRPPANFLD
jgi:L-fuculose-phosphate aldolase